IFGGYGFVHGIGYVAIGRVSGGRGAQFGNVDSLGKVHLKQGALAESERDRVLRVLLGLFAARLGKLLDGCSGALHRGFIVGADACSFKFGRRIETVGGREILHDLDAAAMAMHIAETADVHENVEAELLARGEGAQQLVMAATMAQAEVYDFAAARLAGCRECFANLPVGVMTVAVNERGGEFGLERSSVKRFVVK